ncbi:hypothetical protein [Streptomyces sp. CBMA29]|uniref:hypothetical protein n=1 Tax=Streptomyces sp. CBMA29 TaxID=1896314 RepID=UPI001661C4C9|nr:hypothetical protein [Streptomyces sp. CBMA29]MBD0739823.1 hypothetical protein [Streptomyces sp. CBMA29]
MATYAWLVTFTEEDSETTWAYEVEAALPRRPRVVAHMAWVQHNRLGRPEVDFMSPVVQEMRVTE